MEKRLSKNLAELESKLPFGSIISPVVADLESDIERGRDQLTEGEGPPDLPSPELPRLPDFPKSFPSPPRLGRPRTDAERDARHRGLFGSSAPKDRKYKNRR